MACVELNKVDVEYPVVNPDSRSLRMNLIYHGSGRILKRDVGKKVNVLALKNISVKAQDGDRIGLVGRNGSGKTTMLRLIAGIYSPTRGAVYTEGRISSLLGGGLCVDPDLTGYEAIEYGCLMLGIKPNEIKKINPEIAEFTELGDYLAMPIRTYSSGMNIRLSFALATITAPDILLMDEVIGAGDAYFIEKAKQRSTEFMEKSSIIFLASHSDTILQTVCNKAILLDQGEIIIAGDVGQVLNVYHSGLLDESPGDEGEEKKGSAISGGDSFKNTCNFAFNGCLRTCWLSSQKDSDVRGKAFIGYDFGPGGNVAVRQFTIRQWNGGHFDNMVTGVRVQYSNDNFTKEIKTAGIIPIAAIISRNSYEVSNEHPARYWRLLADSGTDGGPWGIVELTFNDPLVHDTMEIQTRERALSSGYIAPYKVQRAFDGRLDTQWISSAKDPEIKGMSWIGYNFGANRKVEILRFAIRQWDAGLLPNTVGSVLIQYSNDGFVRDIHDADTVTIDRDTEKNIYKVKPSTSCQFWRLLANTETGGGRWGIVELEFSDTPDPITFEPEKLKTRVFHGSAPISYHHATGHEPGMAFDGNSHTHWLAPDSDPLIKGTAWIGYDFGEDHAVEPRRFVIRQYHSGFQPNSVSSVIIQYSSDGFIKDVHTADKVDTLRNSMRNEYEVRSSEKSRYWRLMANSGTGGGQWGVVDLEFWDDEGLLAGAPPG